MSSNQDGLAAGMWHPCKKVRGRMNCYGIYASLLRTNHYLRGAGAQVTCVQIVHDDVLKQDVLVTGCADGTVKVRDTY